MADRWSRLYLRRRGGAPSARRRDGRAEDVEALAGAARRRVADERSIDLAAAAIVSGLPRREEWRRDGFPASLCSSGNAVIIANKGNQSGPFICPIGPSNGSWVYLMGLMGP